MDQGRSCVHLFGGCLVALEQVQLLQSKGDGMARDTSKAVEKK